MAGEPRLGITPTQTRELTGRFPRDELTQAAVNQLGLLLDPGQAARFLDQFGIQKEAGSAMALPAGGLELDRI